MKKVILLLVLLPCLASAQVYDNFEQGLSDSWVQSLSSRWSADSAGALSGGFSLHHSFDNPEAGTDRIGIPVINLHASEGVTTWSFIIRHGYDPSSSNNWSVFLMSDVSPYVMSADGVTNGYEIGVNLTGYDDTLRLWKVKGNDLFIVVNCHINWQTVVGTVNPAKIIVERDEYGTWEVNIYKMDGSLISSSSGYEPELFEPSWFVVSYRYSSTRDRLLWIDDISIDGIFYEDLTAPSVTGYTICGRRSIELMFDEEPVDSFTAADNFSLNNSDDNTVTIRRRSELSFILDFADEFINKQLNSLTIRNLCDTEGNCKEDTIINFIPIWAETGDVIISEIMADPVPAVSLPAREYFELMNRSAFSLDLEGWKFTAGNQIITMPVIKMEPNEIRIISSLQDTSYFNGYGKVTGIRQFPSLTDQGKLLCLTDTSGLLIHGVEYSYKWYGSDLKSQGGWSLEIIDTSFPFYYEGNWKASVSRSGGTPGIANSVSASNPDRNFHGIINLFPESNNVIILSFSEPVTAYETIYNSTIKGGPEIAEVYISDALLREFNLLLSSPLEDKVIYELQLSEGITDFAYNRPENSAITFGLTETPASGDISFNELLFNPFPGDPDYIELHNCSDKVFDASRLYLASVNEITSDTSDLIAVSLVRRCILPGMYYVITTESQKVTDRYSSSSEKYIFEISSMPSMPDDKGILLLMSSELDIIDKVSYNEEMHYSLLAGVEGISLEKAGECNPSGESASWHSAAESSGWGTPGRPNSLFTEKNGEASIISLSSTKITPDNDGFEDFLSIGFNPSGNDNVVSISVFDETGCFIKKIASNMLTGSEVTFVWDGTADDGSPVRSGIYIVFSTWFDDTGKSEQLKRVCTVLR